MKINQKGFASVELIVAVIVIAGIVGASFYVYSAKTKQENAITTSATKPSTTLPSTLRDLKPVSEIRKTAETDAKTASIVSVQLANQNGTVVYIVKLSDGRVLTYNAKSAAKLSEKKDKEASSKEELPSTASTTAKITVENARSIAAGVRAGQAIKEIELESQNGTLVYVVSFADGSEVTVNATSGAASTTKQAEKTEAEKKTTEKTETESNSKDSSGEDSSHN